ncbi:MAG: helix-turn-helix transcriptional regulator [Oscillospiraceae bacterium]|nr:helix-turn-helix transcriptional regulator [Oscillospiraceae bacterium]
MDSNFIADRIAALRTAQNVSARDMSLSLGQSQSYINNIENKKALPSMQMFLYICEYLKIEPKDFFDESVSSPDKINEVIKALKPLKRDQLDILLTLVKEMK